MYLGDYQFGTTVHRMFTTVGSSGAPAALSSANISVYRDGSSVEDATGVSLTVDYDRTGQNKLVVSMTTGGFYSSAGEYMAVITSGGVASADLAGYVVAQWSLERNPFFSTAGLETLSTVGLETLSTVGIETVSTAGLETAISSNIAAQVWNSTRANFTAAGSFGQVVSTSTAAPFIYVSNSTLVTSQFSTVGLETVSTVGLETLSTAGLETAVSSNIAAQVWNSTRANFTAAGSFGQIVSTSTTTPFQSVRTATGAYNSSLVTSQFSTAGLETAISSDIAAQVWNSTRANFTASGSFGEVVSTSTAAPNIHANSTLTSGGGDPSSDIAAAVWNTTRSNFTAAGSFGQIVSTSTADPSIWVNSAAGSASSDIAASVWNTTRANFTAAGSFGQIVSTSTATPLIYVSNSTLVTSQFSTVGLETVSTAGLETASSRVDIAMVDGSSVAADNLGLVFDSDDGLALAYMGPRGPGVYIDDAAGNTNTVLGTDGTADNPVSTIAAAKTIADAMSQPRFYIANDTLITLGAAMDQYEFVGLSDASINIINMGDQLVSNCSFYNLTLEGDVNASSGRSYAENCILQDESGAGTSTFHLYAVRCGFKDSFRVTANDDHIFEGCYSMVAGNGTPVIDCNSAICDISIRHYSGGIEFQNTNAAGSISVETDGQVVFNANCNANTSVTIRGMMSVTGSSRVTLTDDAVYNSTYAANHIWNATRADYTAAGSFGQIISTSTAAPLIYVSNSTLVTSQFSTVGLETLSTVGIETVSTAGLETASSNVNLVEWRGLTPSTLVGGSTTLVPVSTLVTSQFSTVGLETASSLVTAANYSSNVNLVEWRGLTPSTLIGGSTNLVPVSTLVTSQFSTAGLETVSTAGLETASSIVEIATAGMDNITLAEPAFGTPTTLPTLPAAIGRVYHSLRNQITVSSSAKVFYGDAGSVLWGKVLSQDTTASTGIFTEAGASTST